ncbi:MAG: GNAT family N-acetyltransferase [Geminicoccaceae bacterium]
MTAEPVLRTERLILRHWRSDDLDALAAMNADPEVMRYFPACLERAESAAMMMRVTDHFERYGFGFWVLEVPDVHAFAGCAGLLVPAFHAHFTPCVEVGWRLPRAAWGHGYATEAGRAALDLAFDRLGLDEVVSMAVDGNHRSTRVMERLGMKHRPADDFGHPKLPFGHPLRSHVLYRLGRKAWAKNRRDAD